MSDPLADRFPTLFYDISMVERRDPKPMPSLAQVLTAVLQANGVTNNAPAVAGDLMTAINQYNARVSPVSISTTSTAKGA